METKNVGKTENRIQMLQSKIEINLNCTIRFCNELKLLGIKQMFPTLRF